MRHLAPMVVGLVLGPMGSVGAQQHRHPFVDSLFRARFSSQAPGAAVAAFRADTVLHLGTYGLASIAEGRPITAATNFYLASVSKPFTAFVVHRLVQGGQLRLEERLVDLIPELGNSDSTITVGHLLTHSSGLADFYSFIDWPRFKYLDNAGVMDTTRNHPVPTFPPGTRYQYSNTGYVLLSVIVERRAGRKLGDVLAEHVFRPLTMASLVYDDTAVGVPNRAIGYYDSSGKWLLSDLDALELPDGRLIRFAFTQTGQGGVFASIADMTGWGMRLLDTAYFTPRDRNSLWSPRLDASAQKGIDTVAAVALGWFVSRRNGRSVIWHDGNRGGAKAIIALLPDPGFGVVILSNREDADPIALAALVVDRLADSAQPR